MSTTTINVSYADVGGFPAGSAVDHITVSISATQSQDVPAATASVSFADVAPGDYTATASAKDATGAVLGTPATASFTVVAPATVTLSLPATVTVTQA